MYLIRRTYPVARKTYRCDAYYWIDQTGYYEDLTEEEQRQVDACNWLIKPGEKYIYEVQKDGGELVVFRANIAMNDICLKYHLYEE